MKNISKPFAQFLKGLDINGYIDLKDVNFQGTPDRMSRMYQELLDGAINTNARTQELFEKKFPSKYNGIVIAKDIKVTGLCPHHFLPVNYTIDIGYIPRKDVIGVSKLHRICKILASRAVLQEDLTYDIIGNMEKHLNPLGAIVIVEGVHGCMTSRGIKQENPIITSQILGDFEESGVRSEFLSLIGRR